MKFLSVAAVLATAAGLALMLPTHVLVHDSFDAMAVALAGGIFTIALAVYIRE